MKSCRSSQNRRATIRWPPPYRGQNRMVDIFRGARGRCPDGIRDPRKGKTRKETRDAQGKGGCRDPKQISAGGERFTSGSGSPPALIRTSSLSFARFVPIRPVAGR
jgi:hypothetical protein